MLRLVVMLLVSSALSLVGHAQVPARNVILFLADAAGIPVLNAASLHAYGEGRRLFVQRMPHIGLSDTATASEFVTDSAAGMTAIVTGQRTHNGVIGQGPDAVRSRTDGAPLKTILEYAEERGLATGLISNDALTGATPAALYAHQCRIAAWVRPAIRSPRCSDAVSRGPCSRQGRRTVRPSRVRRTTLAVGAGNLPDAGGTTTDVREATVPQRISKAEVAVPPQSSIRPRSSRLR